MIEEIGVITAVDKDHIWVETQIKTTCGSCQAQDNCATGVVAKAFSPKKEQLILRCRQQAEVGQKVKLGIQESHLLGASALVYMLPLVVLISVAVAGQYFLPTLGLTNELWIVAASALATYACFRWVKTQTNHEHEHKFQPKLLAIIPFEQPITPVKQVQS